jgi:hypothetical protein
MRAPEVGHDQHLPEPLAAGDEPTHRPARRERRGDREGRSQLVAEPERIAEPHHGWHRALAGGGVASHTDTGRLESFDGSVYRLADLPAQVKELVAVARMDGDPPRRDVILPEE